MKKGSLCVVNPPNIFLKVLGDYNNNNNNNQDVFGERERSLRFLFGQQWFSPCNAPKDAIFVSFFLFFFYCSVMNSDLN